ncbi:SPOR domain-containing protein [Desulforhabdus amnigena]|jgi:tetratricopeptide (TPR) repeat protein|uniref:SPOR domain-containing protein n=1 Tax=Desulforhabdus amnigena TaxID=40218 RepID=A0A9W6FSS8_9BACT|nr:tetratricopeptide repeat protein [Desulforhabdus amnigena]NLJ29348.1 tetratricopeptide repeat protein [Deltaproteobacteria bacterium]GLI34384.1 hypothetical protein DAMNIGENAA_18170 [Desulforhabdus amnigena]
MSWGICHRIFWIFLLLVSMGCATAGTSRHSADQLRKMGEGFLAAGDLGQALKFLTQAEAKQPNDPVIHYDLGLAYDERGLSSDALKHFQKALSLKPDYSEAYNALGRHYARQNQLDLAQDSFEKALSNPFYSTPHLALYNLGLIYDKKGDREAALQRYQEAVRLQPNYGLAYFQIGQILEEMKRGDEARAAYGKAIQYSPDLVAAHFRYGVMSYTAGELERAFYSLSRVVKLEPYSPMADEARKYLAKLQSVVGNPSEPSSNIPSPDQTDQMTQLEVVDDQDLQGSQASPPEEGAWQSRQESGTHSRAQKKAKAVTATASPSVKRATYIVQVGSYLNKSNAEDEKRKLEAKGYDVVMKKFTHQVLGPLYVIQLKPEEDEARAADLLSQIQGSGDVKPIIIKVPATF